MLDEVAHHNVMYIPFSSQQVVCHHIAYHLMYDTFTITIKSHSFILFVS